MIKRILECWLGLALALSAQDLKTLQPQGYVSDFAGVVDAGARQRIEQYCSRVEQSTGTQMAIVTVDTLHDEPIDRVANELFRRWGIGKKGEDNGLLLLLAIKDRKQRLEVGRRLEPILPDGFDGSVLREMRPILQQRAYGPALLAGAQVLGSKIAQAKGVQIEAPAEEVYRPRRPASRTSIPFPLIIVGLLLLFWLLSRGGGGGVGGFLTGMFLGNILGGGRGGGGGFGGGGFGGGGGGGGGFGGFGGGDSGGGGASSDW